MRLPLVAELESRDGSANKDERLTNVLAEQDEGVVLAVLRPGCSTLATYSGAGNGMVAFASQNVSIYGDTIHVTTGTFALPSGTFTPA